jgi:hypothetical protein
LDAPRRVIPAPTRKPDAKMRKNTGAGMLSLECADPAAARIPSTVPLRLERGTPPTAAASPRWRRSQLAGWRPCNQGNPPARCTTDRLKRARDCGGSRVRVIALSAFKPPHGAAASARLRHCHLG